MLTTCLNEPGRPDAVNYEMASDIKAACMTKISSINKDLQGQGQGKAQALEPMPASSDGGSKRKREGEGMPTIPTTMSAYLNRMAE
ncbi:hypothetical protein GPECTOR_2067g1067 [Gonium pectorale]|uniref:Uncharacterized protein n=1 Tax=Gonium pectorale TaxID=33097 RepID=A0A150FT95_GONPE|nr:hypothetical protein GPECTOR_2067g1067 [Gonium pectorale]|eukprot:KXZ40829.1 hypothetical protein GPECTOR_2067g1067 [Gonium pectorale]